MARIKGIPRSRATVRLFVAAIALASAQAQASVTSFSTYAGFQGATLSLSEFGFDSFAPGGGSTQSYLGNPVSPAGSGVAFTALESIVSDPGIHGGGYSLANTTYTGKSNSVSETTPNTITATVTGAPTAVGFYFGSFNFSDLPLSVKVTSNGTDTTFGSLTLPSSVTLPATTDPYVFNFIGFTSTSAITQVVFTQAAPGDVMDIQRFSVGSIAAIPEPSIPALFVLGLALIGTIIRRKSR